MNKRLLLPAIIISIFFLASCNETYTFDKAGMEKVNQKVVEKFGKDAWYTTVSYAASPDNENVYVISADKCDDPATLMQERWVCQGSDWEKLANVNLDIKNGEAQDYMFQLDKNDVSLAKLGELISQSKSELAKEKNIPDAKLKIALVATNNIVIQKEDRITYTIIWKDKNNQTYSYTYSLDGKLKRSNL